jgi:anti-anti-sigma regulatory factor
MMDQIASGSSGLMALTARVDRINKADTDLELFCLSPKVSHEP